LAGPYQAGGPGPHQPTSWERLAIAPQTPETRRRILFAGSEAHPLIKTGGLADVAGALPAALRDLGYDARLILPAYPRAVRQLRELRTLADLRLPGSGRTVRILDGRLPDSELPTFLVDAPDHFAREGNPYTDTSGGDWGDNADRFMLFCEAVARIGMGTQMLDWRPDLVHCNDWQTGLVPALLHGQPDRPATVFTIHNLAYQGLFDRTTFDRLRLPEVFWTLHSLEFHKQLSFIKGGIVFSDRVNTVSPTYAREVRTREFGCGLDGLLSGLGRRFSGILNGIDYRAWNPAEDTQIAQPYNSETFSLKAENKLALQREFGLPRNEEALVFGHIGRLVQQKGADLILGILPRLLAHPNTQFILQGSGEKAAENALLAAARAHPDRVGIFIGYDEGRAHRVEAGSDAFLMPSRFEPCGLNQIYSLRYGAVPLVRRTGGLADTVIDAGLTGIEQGVSTGFCFDQPSPDSLWQAMERCLKLFRDRPDLWRRLALNGMAQDFSWSASARHYDELYTEALGA
jgi:starch synthase